VALESSDELPQATRAIEARIRASATATFFMAIPSRGGLA
jgi:hypothetical protein